MKFDLNWKNIAALLTGIAGVVAAVSGHVPPEYSEIVAGVGSGLLVLAGLFGDSDGDGIPNLVDAAE